MNATANPASPGDWSLSLQIFVYLQALDLLTTWSGLRMGLEEASPFIHLLMRLGPGMGILAGKIIAVLLGGFCVWTRRARVIRTINWWFAALVAWNFRLIIFH